MLNHQSRTAPAPSLLYFCIFLTLEFGIFPCILSCICCIGVSRFAFRNGFSCWITRAELPPHPHSGIFVFLSIWNFVFLSVFCLVFVALVFIDLHLENNYHVESPEQNCPRTLTLEFCISLTPEFGISPRFLSCICFMSISRFSFRNGLSFLITRAELPPHPHPGILYFSHSGILYFFHSGIWFFSPFLSCICCIGISRFAFRNGFSRLTTRAELPLCTLTLECCISFTPGISLWFYCYFWCWYFFVCCCICVHSIGLCWTVREQ